MIYMPHLKPLESVDYIVIHCSATPSNMPLEVNSRLIHRWHRQKGWKGCGYHFVLPENGIIESHETGHPCRPINKQGAHVGRLKHNLNKRSIGICLAGGVEWSDKYERMMPSDNYNPLQWKSLKNFVFDMKNTFPHAKIIGHNELTRKYNGSYKACPSFDVQAWLKKIGLEQS